MRNDFNGVVFISKIGNIGGMGGVVNTIRLNHIISLSPP